VVWDLVGGERNGPLAVFDAREALVLRGGENDAIADEAGRRVVIGGVDSERIQERQLPFVPPGVRAV
jgi:hypothetical protein